MLRIIAGVVSQRSPNFLIELGAPYDKIGAEGKIRHKQVAPLQARDVEGLMAIIEDIRG